RATPALEHHKSCAQPQQGHSIRRRFLYLARPVPAIDWAPAEVNMERMTRVGLMVALLGAAAGCVGVEPVEVGSVEQAVQGPCAVLCIQGYHLQGNCTCVPDHPGQQTCDI